MSEPDLALGRAPEGFRSGFVSLVGRPNVGKSTLLNQMLRQKVAITSRWPQTTRNAIRGVFTTDVAQMVFVDTPGMHKPLSALGRQLNEVAAGALADVDVAVFLVDAKAGIGTGDAYLARRLVAAARPVIVAVNKVDAVSPAQLDAATAAVQAWEGAWPVFPVSARVGAGLPQLMHAVVDQLPEGPLYYPPDAVTDQPLEARLAELIREKVLNVTRQEVPHSVAVGVDEIARDERPTRVSASIYVERDSQKGIVIGRGGERLREIGSRARREIEATMGEHVYLDLRVRVERDWSSRSTLVERFGYGR